MQAIEFEAQLKDGVIELLTNDAKLLGLPNLSTQSLPLRPA